MKQNYFCPILRACVLEHVDRKHFLAGTIHIGNKNGFKGFRAKRIRLHFLNGILYTINDNSGKCSHMPSVNRNTSADFC